MSDIVALLRKITLANHWPVEKGDARTFLSSLPPRGVAGSLSAEILAVTSSNETGA